MSDELKKENFLKRYFVDSFRELSHVTWPTKNQAVNLSIIVVVFVFLSGLILAGIDFVFGTAYEYLLGLK